MLCLWFSLRRYVGTSTCYCSLWCLVCILLTNNRRFADCMSTLQDDKECLLPSYSNDFFFTKSVTCFIHEWLYSIISCYFLCPQAEGMVQSLMCLLQWPTLWKRDFTGKIMKIIMGQGVGKDMIMIMEKIYQKFIEKLSLSHPDHQHVQRTWGFEFVSWAPWDTMLHGAHKDLGSSFLDRKLGLPYWWQGWRLASSCFYLTNDVSLALSRWL